jgi:hypothetical protein
MKFTTDRPYADPEAAARKLIEIANSVEAVQDGRIYIELINGPMLFELKTTPAEYSAGLKLAIERGWLTLDRSGTYVKFTGRGGAVCVIRRPTGAGLLRRPRTHSAVADIVRHRRVAYSSHDSQPTALNLRGIAGDHFAVGIAAL